MVGANLGLSCLPEGSVDFSGVTVAEYYLNVIEKSYLDSLARQATGIKRLIFHAFWTQNVFINLRLFANSKLDHM